MRFSRILHPEVVLNKRGPADMREFYKLVMSAVTYEGGAVTIERSLCPSQEAYDVLISATQQDPNLNRHLIHCMEFKNSKDAKIYHIGKPFAEALMKLDRDIPVDVIPERFIGYFSFPENTVFDDDGEIQGGYVYTGFANQYVRGMAPGARFISVSYLNTKVMMGMHPITTLTVELTQAKVDELYASVKQSDDLLFGRKATDEEIVKRKGAIRLLVNALVYLFSQDPLIEISRPVRELGLSKKEINRRGGVINECTLPVYFLYRAYQTQRVYSVDSIWVDPFFRWQRCGPGFSQVRLTLVSGHERKYE